MSLYDVRQGLVESITASGLRVIAYGPEKITPPVVILEEGSPYVAEGDTFNPTQLQVSYDLWLFGKNGGNENATRAMDDMIENVIFNLGDWTIKASEGHFLSQVGENVFLVSKISVTKFTEIGGS